MKLAACFVLFCCVACTTEPAGDGATTSGSGGSGPAKPLSSKPQCENPNMPTGGVPPARADAAAALSSDGKSMVMFGGDVAIVVCGSVPKRDHVGDTWLLDTACGGWTKLAAMGPTPRARHSMAGDFARNRALLFGGRFRQAGQSGNYTLYNDVWTFDFASLAWSQVQTTGTAPSPRANGAMVVDGDTLWVFGGSTTPDPLTFAPTNDLYALDLKTNQWRTVPAKGTPPAARLFHAMAIDPAGHRAFVAYGGDANAFVGPFFKDLFALDLASSAWAKIAAPLPPSADFGRIKLGLAVRRGLGSEARRLFAFAGHDDLNDKALGNRNDVIALELPIDGSAAGAWQQPIKGDSYNNPPKGMCNFPADFAADDSASIERRSSFAFAPLESGEAFVVFGGDSDCGRLSDAWWYDTRANRWEAIAESLPGLTCVRTGNPSCKSLCG